MIGAAAAARIAAAAAALAQAPQAPAPAAQAAPATNDRAVWFADATDESGLGAFLQKNGDAAKSHITSSNGGGLALFDCDGDGDLDVFFVSGSRLGGMPKGETASNRLYRNLGGCRFEDATEAAGLDSHGAFGQGCAVADVDGDGRLDLFVTNIGRNSLYLNSEGGRFTECAEAWGVAGGGWNSGAAFFDYDRDGDLDLYVSRYITLEPGVIERGPAVTPMSEWKGQRVFKGPHELEPAADSLYRNDGHGRFTDVTKEAGMAGAAPSFGFQPVSLDFDGDGDVDLFVANDSMANFLWRNEGNGTFTDVALMAGVAFNANGRPQSNMGVTAEDFDDDGLIDLFITTFSDDAKTLFRNGGKDWFTDVSPRAGLGGAEVFRALSWGTSLFDADNDGDLDLFVANGHIYPQADLVGGGYSYGQKDFLFLQTAPGRFKNVSDAAGPAFEVKLPSRGSAVGDLDDDGDLDVVVNHLDAKPTLLRNDSAKRGHFLAVRLRGTGLNRSAIGARVTLFAGNRRRIRELRSSSSYLSHEDLRAHFGLGDAAKVDRVEVRWPDGKVETIAAPPVDRTIVVEQGKGLVGR
jgi:hypothetical protein